MRMLSRCVLLGFAAFGLSSHVEASCKGGPSDTDIPDANALTLFVTSANAGVLTGDLIHFGQSATTGDTVGLTAGDHICTYYAKNPGGATLVTQRAKNSATQPYFNQDTNGNTVNFRAVLSSDTTNAIDRFADINNINIVDANTRKCLAANISDLFAGSNGFGYGYSLAHLFTEAGATLPVNTQVWTGTGAILTDSTKTTADIPGGKFHANGKPVNTSQGFCYNPTNAQAWTSSDVTVNGAVGIIVDALTQNVPNHWIYDQNTPNGLACSQGVRLYCLSGQPFNPPTTPTPTVNGDPQFVGLQGQSFQVHGMPDEFFNLITTPEFQLNSRFTYLASGSCNYNNTECWTHPGTYVDQLGFMFPGINIKTIAGPHHKGLRVWVNDEEMRIHTKLKLTTTMENNNSTQSVIVRHPHHDILIISGTLFTVEITNSDWFFNFNLQFHVPEILSAGRILHHITTHAIDTYYPSYPMHGLVGQTWKNARYMPGKRMYVGEIDDYMLTDHALFSTQCTYNLYQY